MTFRTVTHLGVRLARAGAGAAARRVVPLPDVQVAPSGRMVELVGRGRTYVIDVPGPTPDAPVVVLLHALGVTAYLSWFTTIAELALTHRVVTFDQRWHGRGIRSERFRFVDCADDAVAVMDALGIDRAVVAGYSMGGAVAQLTWRRHPDRVAGLVLCSTARNFRGKAGEKAFFPVISVATHPLSGYALTRVERVAQQLPEVPSVDMRRIGAWGVGELRSTSPWSMPEVLSELGRFNSASWIHEVDVPTAVVVTERDHTIPARRQHKLAQAVPGADVRSSPGGHTSLFLDAKRWVPVFVDAVQSVTERAAASDPVSCPCGASARSAGSSVRA